MHKKYIRDKVLTFHLTLLKGQNKVGDDSTTEVKGQGVTKRPLIGVKISKWEFCYSESRFGFFSKK